jgi:CRP/FNR family cyclic AMP-dependent transcriptional regulator
VISDTTLQRPAADAFATTLAQCPAQTARALRDMGMHARWKDGEVMLRGGEVARTVSVIVGGRLRLVGTSAMGKEVLFRWFLPGEFVGLASLLAHSPLPAEAIADGACESIQLDGRRLLAHLEHDAQGALYFAGVVARLATEVVGQLLNQTAGALEERITSVLDRLASHEAPDPHVREIKLPLSHRELALAVGASRQRVSVELSKLVDAGRLRIGYRHLVLLRPPPPK